ncbi:MAG TPA: TROVE domain-containing protein [Ktedonobacterales bacterium]
MKPKTKATKITRLFAPGAYDVATETNYEGAPTFSRSDEEALARVLRTGMLEPTVYASAQELAEEALALFAAFAAKDPRYLAQAIVYARNEGLMRLAPLTALVALSAAPNEDAKEMFRLIFPRVVRTPGDLQDVISLIRAKKLRGMGKLVQRAAGRWLGAMSEYHAIKYGAESQEMSLRDIYRLTRPKLAGAANDIARYLVKGEVADGLAQIAGYEAFKTEARAYRGEPAPDGEKRLLSLIAESRLPWEVVTAQVSGSAAVWTAMLYQMPYMACLAEGTPIWLADGTTAPIEDVVENKLQALSYTKAWDTRPVHYGPQSQPPRDHEVGHLVSTTPSEWIANGVQPVKTVRFRSGRVLDATLDHRWIAQRRGNGRKSWEWRTTAELAAGDHIPSPLTAAFFGSLGSQDDGYFVGAMLGDGGMTSVTPEFHGDPNDGAVAFMRQYAEAHACRVTEISATNTDKIVRLRFPFKLWKRNPLTEILREFDVWGLRCEVTSLPNKPFSAAFWIGCLSGLIDTDGHVHERTNPKGIFHTSVEYATVSAKLAQQVSDALLRFGVMNRVRSYMAKAKQGETIISRHPIHIVEVSRATAVVRLAQLLPLRIGYKADKLASVASRLTHVRPTTSAMYGHDPSVAFDQVVAIEDSGEKPVYCVTVEPSNLLVANGIVTGNCLRNLNNMIKYGVTADRPALRHITNTLADPKRVAESKQFPFRFISALKALEKQDVNTAGVVEIREALETALELSVANMPELGNRVLIANDISGSMSSRPSPKSDMTMAEIAAVFAAAAFLKAARGEIVSFDTEARPRDVHNGQSLSKIAQAVSGYGGGTSLSAPLEYAFGSKGKSARRYDVAIFITDSESWVDHLTKNRGALDLIREYKKRVNPELLVFFLQLMPYRHAVVPPDEPGCYYLYGWDSGALGFIALMARGGASQVEAIRQVSLLP